MSGLTQRASDRWEKIIMTSKYGFETPDDRSKKDEEVAKRGEALVLTIDPTVRDIRGDIC
jgi:hypothetical protein